MYTDTILELLEDINTIPHKRLVKKLDFQFGIWGRNSWDQKLSYWKGRVNISELSFQNGLE